MKPFVATGDLSINWTHSGRLNCKIYHRFRGGLRFGEAKRRHGAFVGPLAENTDIDMPKTICQSSYSSYNGFMAIVPMKEAKNRLTELARRVEKGETIVVTRNGKPAFDLVPHRKKGGLNLKGLADFKKKHGIRKIVTYISEDFDAPLSEDFLLQPLP
jgi:prevent-host-death family protein